MGCRKEQDGCESTRHWWRRSQLLEVGLDVAGRALRVKEVSTDLPSSNHIQDCLHTGQRTGNRAQGSCTCHQGPPAAAAQ